MSSKMGSSRRRNSHVMLPCQIVGVLSRVKNYQNGAFSSYPRWAADSRKVIGAVMSFDGLHRSNLNGVCTRASNHVT